MKLYIVVAMLFYVANGVSDVFTANGRPRRPISARAGLASLVLHVALFAWGAAILI